MGGKTPVAHAAVGAAAWQARPREHGSLLFDLCKVAEHFALSVEEVEAGLAYYRLNKPHIDARFTLNEA